MFGSSDVFDIVSNAESLENEGTTRDPGSQMQVAVATRVEGGVNHISTKVVPIGTLNSASECPSAKGDISTSNS